MPSAIETEPIIDLKSKFPNGLKSNDGEAVPEEAIGSMRPTPADTPIEEMRRLFRDEGYVFVKGLLPREDVLDMREHFFTFLEPTGILKPGTSPRDGIFNEASDKAKFGGIGSPLNSDDYEVQRLAQAHLMPEYLEFLKHPKLRDFVREFMGWERDVLLKRTMMRHSVPGARSTGIHYDKIFCRDGEAEFLTAWVPIGDIAADGGPLIYLSNSSNLGKDTEDDFTRRAASFTHAERIFAYNRNMNSDGTLTGDADYYIRHVAKGMRWLVADYEAGDVVFHDPYMIHAAAKNQDQKGRIRLSTDLRFNEEGSDLDKRWMVDWTPNDGL